MFVVLLLFISVFTSTLLVLATAEDEDSNDEGDANGVANVVSNTSRIGEL